MVPFPSNQRDEYITQPFDMQLLDLQQENHQQEDLHQDDLDFVDELFVPPVAHPGQVVEVLGEAGEGFIVVIHPVLH